MGTCLGNAVDIYSTCCSEYSNLDMMVFGSQYDVSFLNHINWLSSLKSLKMKSMSETESVNEWNLTGQTFGVQED